MAKRADIDVSWEERHPGAIRNMAAMDKLARPWRDLINEFGFVIVRDMRNDGHRDAAKLREELEAWRVRQQGAWLAEIPYQRH